MAGNMLFVLCLLCVAVPLLLGIAYVKFTPGPLAELVPVNCLDGSELPDYVLAVSEAEIGNIVALEVIDLDFRRRSILTPIG